MSLSRHFLSYNTAVKSSSEHGCRRTLSHAGQASGISGMISPATLQVLVQVGLLSATAGHGASLSTLSPLLGLSPGRFPSVPCLQARL